MLVCCRYLPIQADAEDALLEGLHNCFKNLHRFEYRGDGSLKAWLSRIVVNQCLMQLRKRKPAYHGSLHPEDDYVQDDGILGGLSAKEIMKLIQQLPDGYRIIFNLYAFEEKSHKEIALLLGISESTSKSQLFEARKRLKEALTALYP